MAGTEDEVRLSVIIPALNEAGRLETVLAAVLRERPFEVIVVDGGSRDETLAIATQAGAAVICAPPGRAGQMNAGARQASGDALLFLHADTVPPTGFVREIEPMLERPNVVAGAFRLGINSNRPVFRWIERAVMWRSRHWQRPYGDQGLFMWRSVFEKIGGYAPIPIMEDVELVRRLRRAGRIGIVDRAVSTSARRWEATGPIRATVVNMISAGAYRLGVPAIHIYRFRQRAMGMREGREKSASSESATETFPST